MIAELRNRQFDAAVIFSSFRQSPLPAAYLCYLAGIPLRLAASIDGPGSLLTTRHKHPERMMHEVERGLDLVSAIGMSTTDDRLVLAPPPGAAANIMHLAAGSRSLVVVHPGCSMPARTYPWELYAEVVSLLVEQLHGRVVITGVDQERPMVNDLLDRLPLAVRPHVEVAAGTIGFPEFCALIQAADLTITNNTGPMHMSAALRTPVIALFALTNPPEQWGPWRVPHRMLYREVPCRLCYSRICPVDHECLVGVPPSEVVATAAELLGAAVPVGEPVRAAR
jgi:ADP-heptose:LPS heptosyltransferase